MKLVTLLPLSEDENKALARSIQTIKSLTDSNHHTDALKVVARLARDKKAEMILDLIEEIHKIEKGMPKSLSAYRYSIFEKLEKQIRSLYPDPIADQILNGL